MSKPLKIKLVLFVLLLLFATAAVWLLSRVANKSELESAASAASGLQVSVGKASIGLLPTLHVTLDSVTVRNQQAQIATVGEADVGVELLPLLRKQVRLKRVTLKNLDVTLTRDREGKLNVSMPARTASRTDSATRTLHLQLVSLVNASFHYRNADVDKNLPERKFDATGCALQSTSVDVAAGNAHFAAKLSLLARAACDEMSNNRFVGRDVKFTVKGKDGKFKIEPLTMQTLGGNATGIIDMDFTAAAPVYRVQYTVTQLQAEQLFATLSNKAATKKVGDGLLDFTADLTLSGRNVEELTRTALGEASLRGKNIQLAVGNLDDKFAHYESSQNFSLVDVGAFLIAGPLGTAVTKGYDFATLLETSSGDTQVRTFVSQWHVEQGIAHAEDVAMATQHNRVAMQGALDFADKKFDDVTLALLDDDGCARVEQKIHGSFREPIVDKPNVLVSLLGPVSSLASKVKKFVGAKCQAFYSGSVSSSAVQEK